MAVENGFFSCFMSVEFLESSSEAARVSCTLVMQSACFTMTEIGEAGMPSGDSQEETIFPCPSSLRNTFIAQFFSVWIFTS